MFTVAKYASAPRYGSCVPRGSKREEVPADPTCLHGTGVEDRFNRTPKLLYRWVLAAARRLSAEEGRTDPRREVDGAPGWTAPPPTDAQSPRTVRHSTGRALIDFIAWSVLHCSHAIIAAPEPSFRLDVRSFTEEACTMRGRGGGWRDDEA